MVVHHFEKTLVADDERARFQINSISHEKLKDSTAVKLSLLLATYAIAAWLSRYLGREGSEFLSWWIGSSGGFANRPKAWACR
jgi:hypothetical protein